MKRVLLFVFWVSLLGAERIPGLFIVELAEEPGKTTAREAAIAREGVARQLAASGVQVLDTTERVLNSLIVSSAVDDPATLAATAGVKKVYPVYEVFLELDRARALHRAQEAWTQVGGIENAGKGIKIAILDTGIQRDHPGFQDPSLPLPAGFPRGNRDSDLAGTSNKIIVARSYAVREGEEPSPEDVIGHGTAVAMVAAGVLHNATFGEISGIAPKAWLGSYKVFGANGVSNSAVIIKAIDDAVVDGMDIINLSLGLFPAPRPEDDPVVQAVERASRAGVLVVKSAGNSGPDPATTSSPGAAPSILSVGSSSNARILGAAAIVGSAPPYAAIPAAAPFPDGPIQAEMADVAALDQTGQACSALPEGSLAGKIALILRGSCFFEVKLNNAQRAGAVAGLVYTDANQDVVTMAIGTATLPALMVSHADGLQIKSQIREEPGVRAVLRFEGAALPVDPRRVSRFSSRGPGHGFSISPDLLATGQDVYTAAQTTHPDGDIYDPRGYAVVSGTSFSAPMVSGAAAVVKSFRPGLTVEQYKSLLVNSASPLLINGEAPAGAQQAGAGVLNIYNALLQTTTVSPVSLSFGSFGATADVWRQLKVTNISSKARHYVVDAQPLGSSPAVLAFPRDFWLEGGASMTVNLKFEIFTAEPGEYQGVVLIRSGDGDPALRIPYWYGVADGFPRRITVLSAPSSAAAGSVVNILFRMTDAAGAIVSGFEPAVIGPDNSEILEVRSLDATFPGVYRARVRLEPTPGANVFSIHAWNLVTRVTIRGN
jgi:subtilisin family serine protease